MKKILKNRVFLVIITAIICISISTYAAIKIQASEIGYKNGSVEDALNNLYNIANGNLSNYSCILLSGNKETIGSEYACNLGDGVYRNFYLLKLDGNNVKLIMEKNLSDEIIDSARTMTYANALTYFDSGHSGYTTKQKWLTKVISVDLPDAQDIVDASLIINPKNDWTFDISTESATWWCLGSHEQDEPNGPAYCPTSTAQQNISWLFDYTRNCSSRGCSNSFEVSDSSHANGYWTKNLVSDNHNSAWNVGFYGTLTTNNASGDLNFGVRPVITILKSKLSN